SPEERCHHLLQALTRPARILLLPTVQGQQTLPVDRETNRQAPDAAVARRGRVTHEAHREAQRLRDPLHLGALVRRVEAEAEYAQSRLRVVGEIVREQRQLLAAWRAPGRPEGEDDNVPEKIGAGDALAVERPEPCDWRGLAGVQSTRQRRSAFHGIPREERAETLQERASRERVPRAGIRRHKRPPHFRSNAGTAGYRRGCCTPAAARSQRPAAGRRPAR